MAGDVEGPGGSIEGEIWKTIGATEETHPGPTYLVSMLVTRVQIQNQHDTHANKWDRTGRMVEALPYNQYLVRVDGSGRITRYNRKTLRKILAFEPEGMTVPPD